MKLVSDRDLGDAGEDATFAWYETGEALRIVHEIPLKDLGLNQFPGVIVDGHVSALAESSLGENFRITSRG